jgi:hypothetical protein
LNAERHQQINLTATRAILFVLNVIKKEKEQIEIPYFFGGDRATFIISTLLLKNERNEVFYFKIIQYMRLKKTTKAESILAQQNKIAHLIM